MKIKVPYWQVIAIPILLFLAGAASNQAVLVANWGKFPVMVNDRALEHFKTHAADDDDQKLVKRFTVLDTAVREGSMDANSDQFLDDVHSIMGHNSNLKFLADYINLKTAIYSPGDLLLELGLMLWPFAIPMWLALVIRKFNE